MSSNNSGNKENTPPNAPSTTATLPAPPAKKAIWTARDDATLVQCLIEQQALGNQADNSWKKVTWTACAEALAGSELISGGAKKTAVGCKDHFNNVSIFVLCIIPS